MRLSPKNLGVGLVLVGLMTWGGVGCASSPRSGQASANHPSAIQTSEEGNDSGESDSGAPDERDKGYAHYAAGIYYELEQDPERALEHFTQAALADPGNEALALDVSRRLLQQKKPEKAVQVLTRASAAPGASATTFLVLGITYAQMGKTDDAITAYKTAIKKAPRVMASYQSLAQTYFQKGQKKEALKVLDQAAHQTAPDAAFYVDLAELYASCRSWLGSDGDGLKPKILAALDNASKLKPQQPLVLIRLGDGYKNLQEFSKAIATYQELLKRSPRFPLLREKLADASLQSGDKKGAAEQLEAVVRENVGNAQAYYVLGNLALEAAASHTGTNADVLEKEDYRRAAEYFQKTILFNPDFTPAYFELVSAQLGAEQPKDALTTLAKVPSDKAQNFLVEFYSGLAYNQMKDYAEGLKHMTSAELIARTSDTNRLDQFLYFQLGASYERNKDYPQAEKYFQKCLQVAPDFVEALNYLGYMWAERGVNLDAARRLIEKAVKLKPDNAAYLDSLGWVLFKQNRAPEALPYILKAVALSSKPDPTLYDHLGDIYLALKQPGKARDAWSQSLKAEPNEDIQKKLRDAGEPSQSKP